MSGVRRTGTIRDLLPRISTLSKYFATFLSNSYHLRQNHLCKIPKALDVGVFLKVLHALSTLSSKKLVQQDQVCGCEIISESFRYRTTKSATESAFHHQTGANRPQMDQTSLTLRWLS
ncbi:hypothetical protein DPEC_G00039500 [Dallia pectoralis]|uniref:Uncharacterized protein n=1 Tax=Dallia pectoralis TaxID=75939 RepID=A0ACC2HED1_DALPE|nr:hypothetical protein DPEC_G00039500 [Dallia pectoralis]